jgi:hypothetical protein
MNIVTLTSLFVRMAEISDESESDDEGFRGRGRGGQRQGQG